MTRPGRKAGLADSPWAFPNTRAHRAHPLQDDIQSPSFRSPFARDRDRILYSKPFRRLAHKTQVYLTTDSNLAYDEHSRTRLTHTLEVAQIAKAITNSLGLNCDLSEAIAFGHDVGHAPFGHAGERQIDDFLNGLVPLPRELGDRIYHVEEYRKAVRSDLARDFRHNFQGVRLLSMMERYSSTERGYGLNLTTQTLAGILHHSKPTAIRSQDIARYPDARHIPFGGLVGDPECQSVEALIVAISDEIAQVVHDLCDAMKTAVITIKDLIAKHSPTASVLDKCVKSARDMGKELDFSLTADRDEIIAQFCSAAVNYFATKTADEIRPLLRVEVTVKPQDIVAVRERIGTKPFPHKEYEILRAFKDDLIVNNFHVNRMDNRGRYIIRQLVRSYLSDPRQVPDSMLREFSEMKKLEMRTKGKEHVKAWFTQTCQRFGLDEMRPEQIDMVITIIDDDTHGAGIRHAPHDLLDILPPYLACDTDYLRMIADYIASMTDRYAEREFTTLYE
jgi:dGTPase